MNTARGLLFASVTICGLSAEKLAAQCTTYTITVGGGAFDIEIDCIATR